MAIISEYEEDSEDVETIAKANVPDEDDGYEDEDEDYPPDPYYSSRPFDATSSERPYDEVLGYLLREHQQQPLDLLSTVIEFLFRETGIATQEGVDVRVSEMISAAKRRRVDTDDIEDVFGGPDKIAKFDEIFDDPDPEFEESNKEYSSQTSVSENTQGSSQLSGSSNKQRDTTGDKETVMKTPVEQIGTCRERSYDVHEKDTVIITSPEQVPEQSSFAAHFELATEKQEADNNESGKATDAKDLNPNSGNGADFKKYSWTQTHSDTTLLIPVPIGTTSKSIVCDIQPRYLKVGLKGETPVLEGDLNKPVKPAECFWNLEDGRVLAIHLSKHYTMDWWHCVFDGEPEIDVTKVQLPHASLSDLHPDTRQHVEHMMFHQREAAKELPLGGEDRKSDILRKFMLEGLELYA